MAGAHAFFSIGALLVDPLPLCPTAELMFSKTKDYCCDTTTNHSLQLIKGVLQIIKLALLLALVTCMMVGSSVGAGTLPLGHCAALCPY